MSKPKSNGGTAGTERRGVVLVQYRLNSDEWIYRTETGNDVGRDCVVELVEDDVCHNHKVEGQVKGRTKLTFLDDDKIVSFPLDVKTIEYALGSSTAFVLFVVDTRQEVEKVYYQCIQDYCIENKEVFNKLDQKTINIHIPVSQELSDSDELLKELSKAIYVNTGTEDIKRYAA